MKELLDALQDAGLWLLILHLAFVPLALAARGLRRAGGSGRALRSFAGVALGGALVAASLATFWPRPVPVSEGPRFRHEAAVAPAPGPGAFLPAKAPAVPVRGRPWPAGDPWRPLAALLVGASLAGLAVQTARLTRERRRLAASATRALGYKSVGGLRVDLSAATDVPFVYAESPRRARIVLPAALAEHPRELRLSLAHELQHVRHRDPWWQWALVALDGLLPLNPAYRAWRAEFTAAQEFACDEALCGRSGIDVFEYGRCLLRAAERALGLERKPECAPGFLGGKRDPQLKQRMNRMFQPQQRMTKRWMLAAVGAALALTLGTGSLAARAGLKDRRVSLGEARAWAAALDLTPGFRVAVNDAVVEELNRTLGDVSARRRMRDALERMRSYQPMIEKEIQSRRLPAELLAVPLVESGYRNLKQASRGPRNAMSASPGNQSAGLWQFIPQTARNYGLRVGEKIDERLDEGKLTDAAFRYLSSNHQRFQSWELALLAYNVGEERVQQGIEQTGSRDAWTLIERGYEGDKRYLAKLMAAVLILGRPDALN